MTARLRDHPRAPAVLTSHSANALRGKRDGASRLARALLLADEIHFLVGRAINPAHQSPDIPPELALKGQIVEDMMNLLRQRGIEVSADYY